MLPLILVFIVLCFGCLLVYRKTIRFVKVGSEIPSFSASLPVVGIAHKMLGNNEDLWKFIKTLNDDLDKNGGMMKGWLGPFPIVGVSDPETAAFLMNTILEKPHFYKFGTSWLGDGLVTSSTHIWKRHRKILNPTFSLQMIHSFLDVFNCQSKILVEKLDEQVGKGDFDHWPYLANNALEVICQTALGLPAEVKVVDEEYAAAIVNMLDLLVRRVQNAWMHFDCLYNLSPMKRNEDKTVKILKKMSANILQKRKEAMKFGEVNTETANRFKAFMDVLLELGDKGSMTDEEIREEVDTMIVAGHDTTSSALLFILAVIGSYPEVQERAYQELQEVFNGSKRDVTKDDLPKLVYLEAVIKEALRLYPVVPVVGRYCDRDIKLDNCTVPSDTSVIFFLYGINRHKSWGPDADKFVPERWLDPNLLPPNPSLYTVFSLGRRGCIGKTYALVSMKTNLSHILRKFRIKSDVNKMIVKFDILLKPSSGHHISVEHR